MDGPTSITRCPRLLTARVTGFTIRIGASPPPAPEVRPASDCRCQAVDSTPLIPYPPRLIAADDFAALIAIVSELHREAHIPTFASRARASPRLPRPHGHQERPEDCRPPPRQGPQEADGLRAVRAPFASGGEPLSEPITIERMRTRPQFLAAAKGAYRAHGAVVVQMRSRQDDEPVVRVGFTATKKVGGAVVRNRAKRRLREAARLILPALARPGHDYVFVARDGTPVRDWARLLDDVKSALIRLAADLPAAPKESATSSSAPV
jgi:ribonuclease P protein component